MEQNKALEILVQAVNLAQNKGAFNLVEAKTIAEAVEVFTRKPEVKEETQKEVEPEVAQEK